MTQPGDSAAAPDYDAQIGGGLDGSGYPEQTPDWTTNPSTAAPETTYVATGGVDETGNSWGVTGSHPTYQPVATDGDQTVYHTTDPNGPLEASGQTPGYEPPAPDGGLQQY